jgi:hypothetical protein
MSVTALVFNKRVFNKWVFNKDMNMESVNAARLASLRDAVIRLKAGMEREYDRGVNRDLSQQRYQQVFRRNVTIVLRETYQQVLAEWHQQLFENESQGNQKNLDQGHTLCSNLLQSFDGVIEELILYALQKHRGSCALSNFPDEHNPSVEYLSEVIDETSRDWSAFALQVNKMVAG